MKRFAIFCAVALCLTVVMQQKVSAGNFKLNLSGGFYLTLEGSCSRQHCQAPISYPAPTYQSPAMIYYTPHAPAQQPAPAPTGGAKEGPEPKKQTVVPYVPTIQPASYYYVVPDYWYGQ